MKNSTILERLRDFWKIVRFVVGWLLYNVVFTSTPFWLILVIDLFAGFPLDLNNITPDFLLIGYSLTCTVFLCIFNKENDVKEDLKQFVTMLIIIYDIFAVGVYVLFYIGNKVEEIYPLLQGVQKYALTFIFIMLGFLLAFLLCGAIVDSVCKLKKQKQESKQK